MEVSWLATGRKEAPDPTKKSSLVKFSVLTYNHGVGGRIKNWDCDAGLHQGQSQGSDQDLAEHKK